jgi:hypothetical protein
MRNEKRGPVRRPSTPTQFMRPKATRNGPRSSPLPIQRPERIVAIFADSSGVKGFTLGHRGSIHRPGWRSVAFLRSSEETMYYRKRFHELEKSVRVKNVEAVCLRGLENSRKIDMRKKRTRVGSETVNLYSKNRDSR